MTNGGLRRWTGQLYERLGVCNSRILQARDVIE
jgi:hypothetical protein